MQELLGKHKASPEWYTPDWVWTKVYNTLGTKDVYDPCPIGGSGGLNVDWSDQGQLIYCNPPTPAAEWAMKAIATLKQNSEVSIVYAAFSINVLTQVNELQDYYVCWVRNRIAWIDGRTGKKSTSPPQYSAFILLSNDTLVKDSFHENFRDLGNIRRSYVI